MALRILLQVFLLTWLACNVSLADDGLHDEYEMDVMERNRIVFKFFFDGDLTMVEYRDPIYGYIKMEVPDFLRHSKGDRIGSELRHYIENNRRWSQRMVLESLFYALTYGLDHKPLDLEHPEYPCLLHAKGWLDESVSECEWEGVTCGNIHPSPNERPRVERKLIGKVEGTYDWGPWKEHLWPPRHIVTKIDLPEMKCKGTLPEDLYMLSELRRLNVQGNAIKGTIPSTYSALKKLEFLDLSHNLLSGVPWHLKDQSKSLTEAWLGHNKLEGPISFYLTRMPNLQFLELTSNQITGQIPSEIQELSHLLGLFADHNNLSGTIPSEFGYLFGLEYLHLQQNKITGSLPTELGRMINLRNLWLDHNYLSGRLTTNLSRLQNLEELILSHNQLSGTIPVESAMGGVAGFRWSNMNSLEVLHISNNKLSGTIPSLFVLGISERLLTLDLSFNGLAGTLPTEFGRMTELIDLSLCANHIEGTIPIELVQLSELKVLNLTDNRLVGTVPKALCDKVSLFDSCNSVICPAGTFHPDGAEGVLGGCLPCPRRTNDSTNPPVSKRLGQTKCDDTQFLVGDMDGDGIRSPREILHLLYWRNGGLHWGAKFRDWIDPTILDCELPGITCVDNVIAKIDLSEANLCAEKEGNWASLNDCEGIPAELEFLSDLEVISITRRPHFLSTLPTELARLKKLRYFDLSNNPGVGGTIPTHFANLTNLKVLNLSSCNFKGSIPPQLFKLPALEKLHLSSNPLTGTIPKQIGNAKKLQELMLSRLYLHGTIPRSIGKMPMIENVELYASNIHGKIPNEIKGCTNLKRLDAYNNKLSGSIPVALAKISSLQIIHLKKNQLTGRLPSELGSLSSLTWIDVSSNMISGSIPESFSNIRSLKDLRLGGNRIHNPIPAALCNNNRINGGRARSHGCDAILCPLGYFDPSGTGFAFDSQVGCKQCPNGRTTIYLGSLECVDLTANDILSMLYDVMGGELWDQTEVFRWRSDINICHWNGVICEDSGSLVTISFPLTQTTDPLGDPLIQDGRVYYPS